jgi:hypothetical protein
MSEVANNVEQEFWRPPAARTEATPAMSEACNGCGAEFMVGAGFCHVCGTARLARESPDPGRRWTQSIEYLRFLEFQRVKRWLGLPIPSLIAFLAGVGCLLAAIAVGLVYNVQSFTDFEAVQFWRMQWLLGAVAAFVAGILLRRPGSEPK